MQGKNHAEIGKELGISARTVKLYFRRIYEAHGLSPKYNRAVQLAVILYRRQNG